MQDVPIDSLDRILQFTASYGIAVVFLTSFLLLWIWVAFVLVSLFKKWIPVWFQKSIDSHDKVCKYLENEGKLLDTLNESLQRLHSDTRRARTGTAYALRAVELHLTDIETRKRLGVKEEVLLNIKAATTIFGGQNERRTDSDDGSDS